MGVVGEGGVLDVHRYASSTAIRLCQSRVNTRLIGIVFGMLIYHPLSQTLVRELNVYLSLFNVYSLPRYVLAWGIARMSWNANGCRKLSDVTEDMTRINNAGCSSGGPIPT